jgi:hypothetical protein
MEWFTIITSAVSGLCGASFPLILFYRANKRKQNAEAHAVEVSNDKERIEIYHQMVKDLEEFVCYFKSCKERIK